MNYTKHIQGLKPLLKNPFFTNAEAEKSGIQRQTLSQFTKEGLLIRICPGIYRSVDYEPQVDFQWENLGLVAASIPKGIICLISALCYYNLTDQIMRKAWIAIPHDAHPPKRPSSKIIKMIILELGLFGG